MLIFESSNSGLWVRYRIGVRRSSHDPSYNPHRTPRFWDSPQGQFSSGVSCIERDGRIGQVSRADGLASPDQLPLGYYEFAVKRTDSRIVERKVVSEVEVPAHVRCGVADCKDGYRGALCNLAFVTARNPVAEEARRVVLIQQFARNRYNFVKKPWSSSSTLNALGEVTLWKTNARINL